MVVAVLGHRGMLGSVVARWLREQGEDVRTSDERGVDWIDGGLVIDCTGDTTLPAIVAERCERLIVPSTDAIDEDTPYAAAKREAEKARAVHIRAGIVDIRQRHAVGYVDWLCDPLTPLEWARVAWALRDSVTPFTYIRGRHVVDRWTVATHVARLWDLAYPVPRYGGYRSRVQVGQGGPWIGQALDEYHAWLTG